ncbi:Transcriptional regulator of nonfermentable carbon utilization [Serendipita sp. 399]|nr:Transcriptional regulator of nonfermentable carbon utilization [Serendipita sp. 399]
MSLLVASRYTPVEHLLSSESRLSTASSTSPPTTPGNDPLTKITKTLKRKRPSFSGPASSSGSVPATSTTTDAPKKKKATRACLNCQRAHLTCNDDRPCQRCVKKGIADSCTEGHRKKAKYLLDDEELENLKRNKQDVGKDPVGDPVALLNLTAESILPINFGSSSFTFGSEATNQEYSMLSALLGNTGDEAGSVSLPPPTYTSLSHPQVSQPHMPSSFSANSQGEPWPTTTSAAQQQPTIPRPPSSIYHNHSETPIDLTILSPEVSAPTSAIGLGSSSYQQQPLPPPPPPHFSAPSTSFLRTNHEQQVPPNLSQQQQQQQQYSSILLDPTPPPPEPIEPPHAQPHGLSHADAHTQSRISDVYRTVTKAYDYTQGTKGRREEQEWDSDDEETGIEVLLGDSPVADLDGVGRESVDGSETTDEEDECDEEGGVG